MQNVQNAAFILSVLFGLALVPMIIPSWIDLVKYIKEKPEKQKIKEFFSRHWLISEIFNQRSNITIILIFLIILLISLYLTTASVRFSSNTAPVQSYLHAHGWIPVVAGVIIDLVVGTFTGVLIWQFWKSVNTVPEMKALPFLARLIPVVALLCFGLFRDEISRLANYVDALETSYVKVSFDRRDPEKGLVITNKIRTSTDTDFKAGLEAYKWALTSLKKHDKRMDDLCKPTEIKENITVCASPPPKAKPRMGTQKTFDLTEAYAEKVLLYEDCMDNFLSYFPGGVPIQEELSEIATDYASLMNEEVEVAEALPGNHKNNLGRIFNDFCRIAKLNNREVSHPKNPGSEILDFAHNTWRLVDEFREEHSQDREEQADEAKQNREPLGYGDYFPYRAMIGASLLQMSGYTKEAAHHILRQSRNWFFLHEIAALQEGDAKTMQFKNLDGLDLLTFQAGLELLGISEYIVDRADIPSVLPSVRGNLKNFVGFYLEQNTTLGALEFKPEGIGSVRSALKACQKSHQLGFNGHAEISDELSIVQEQRKYILSLLTYWIHLTMNDIRSIANGEDQIAQNTQEEAKDLFDIAVNDPDLLQSCLGEVSVQNNGGQLGMADWRVVRTLFAYTYAELLAFVTQQASDEQIFRAPNDPRWASGVRQLVCETQQSLRISLELAEDVLVGSSRSNYDFRDTQIRDHVYRAQSLLRDIPVNNCA